MAFTNNPQDGAQANNYESGADVRNTYQLEQGVCVLPLAEDPPTDPLLLPSWSPVVILRLHAPYRIRRVTYTAEKKSNPPVMPSPKDVGAFVFLGGGIGITNTPNSNFVGFDWGVTASYAYVEKCVSRVEDGFVLGIPPWTQASSVGNLATYPPQPGGLGAVSLAGNDVLIARNMGSQVNLQYGAQFNGPSLSGTIYAQGGAYMYNMSSYLPGSFFNDYLVNGGQSPLGE